MLLKALIDYYDKLVELDKVPPYDMTAVNISFAIDLNDDGSIAKIVNLKRKSDDGKKEVPVKRYVPLQKVRSGKKPAPYFLSDTLQHIFGISLKYADSKAKTEHHFEYDLSRREYADDFRKLHHRILEKCNDAGAHAILSFVDSIPDTPDLYPDILKNNIEMLNDNGMQPQIVIRDQYGKEFIEYPGIRSAWDHYLEEQNQNSPLMIDLITGEKDHVAALHGGIKGIGGPANGVSLISYNQNAFESYGLEHGENSPVSIGNVQKYTSVLNYLFAQNRYVSRIGDRSNPSIFITYWAESGITSYQDIFSDEYEGSSSLDRDDLRSIVNALINGKEALFHDDELKPDEKFYILGISTNSARASVQFFYENSFGVMLRNVAEHNERLRIIGAKDDICIPIYRVLSETVRQINGKLETNPSPSITSGMYLSVLQNTLYPHAIYPEIIARINADHNISYAKAEIIKAYLLKNGTIVPKEVLTVGVNNDSSYAPYVLGRVFAVLEKIQKDSSKGISATIKDRYIARAASDPVLVFPGLLRLSQSHQRKLSQGARIYYSNLLNDLLGRLPEKFPKHLNLEEQGSFYLGYYHENYELYKAKDSKNVEEDH